jgi:2-keto-4-pentenoate hydratase
MKKYNFLVLSGFIVIETIFLQPKFKTFNQAFSASKLEETLSYFKVNKNLDIVGQFNEQIIAEEIADRYLKKIPIPSLPTHLTLEQALQIQDKFIQLLVPSYGKIVGYKAGLTNKEVQAKFKIDRPIAGVLLEKMLVKSGAIVSANFGTRPILEGDLMVRVGSEKINTAKTTEEALAALDAVIPFLELPDLVYAENVKLTAPAIVAINVGARLGIMGDPVPLTNLDEWQERLGKIKLIILDESDAELAVGESKALLGDPLKVVLWLRDDLQARGKFLKKGDLLSLGTITPGIPVKSGMKIRARYLELDEDNSREIVVKFE